MFNILNIELSSLCNKSCWMCGRRKIDKDYPELKINYGFMEFSTLKNIKDGIQDDIVIQFHSNGEPLMYPKFKEAMKLFENNIRCMDTNGKLLVKIADDIIGNVETITISTFENDPDADEQLELVKQFLVIKGDKKPNVIIRCLGETKYKKEYIDMGLLTVDRVLHSPMGSFEYKKNPVIPEIGICLEMLNHPVININGDMSICVRFDPERKGVIGNVNKNSIKEIWNNLIRQEWLIHHIEGNRNKVPLCSKCDFWGVPRG